MMQTGIHKEIPLMKCVYQNMCEGKCEFLPKPIFNVFIFTYVRRTETMRAFMLLLYAVMMFICVCVSVCYCVLLFVCGCVHVGVYSMFVCPLFSFFLPTLTK